MITPGLQTSEGKKSLGILITGAVGIYYVLSHRYPGMPSVDTVLTQVQAQAASAADIAKIYAAQASTQNSPSTANGAFDVGTIMAILFTMYKTYSKYTDDRVSLKSKEIDSNVKIIKATEILRIYKDGEDNIVGNASENEEDIKTKLKKF